MSPLERVEALYEDLVEWYDEGSDREIRATSKLLMVALSKLQQNGGIGWRGIAQEYIDMLGNDPARFAKMIESNRLETKKSN